MSFIILLSRKLYEYFLIYIYEIKLFKFKGGNKFIN